MLDVGNDMIEYPFCYVTSPCCRLVLSQSVTLIIVTCVEVIISNHVITSGMILNETL